jgi:hypothetical protein
MDTSRDTVKQKNLCIFECGSDVFRDEGNGKTLHTLTDEKWIDDFIQFNLPWQCNIIEFAL